MNKKIYKYTSFSTKEEFVYFVLIEPPRNSNLAGEIIFSKSPIYRVGHSFVFGTRYCKELNQEEINNLNKLITFL